MGRRNRGCISIVVYITCIVTDSHESIIIVIIGVISTFLHDNSIGELIYQGIYIPIPTREILPT